MNVLLRGTLLIVTLLIVAVSAQASTIDYSVTATEEGNGSQQNPTRLDVTIFVKITGDSITYNDLHVIFENGSARYIYKRGGSITGSDGWDGKETNSGLDYAGPDLTRPQSGANASFVSFDLWEEDDRPAFGGVPDNGPIFFNVTLTYKGDDIPGSSRRYKVDGSSVGPAPIPLPATFGLLAAILILMGGARLLRVRTKRELDTSHRAMTES
jgi:hypothetical protein